MNEIDTVVVLRIWQRDPPTRIRHCDKAAFVSEAIARGLNDRQIADYLGILPNSVYQYRHRRQKKVDE